MPVQRRYAATMFKNPDVAIAAFDADKIHTTVTSSFDHSADRRRVVHAFVSTNDVQNGMKATRVEVRTDACEIQRCTQKRSAHAVSIGREIVGHLPIG